MDIISIDKGLKNDSRKNNMEEVSNIKIISSFGNVISIEEHFDRLIKFTEETKNKVVKICSSNTSFVKFIRQHNIFLSLRMEGRKLICAQGIKEGDPELFYNRLPKEIAKCYYTREITNTKEPIDLRHDFLEIWSNFRSLIVRYYIIPKLVNKKEYLKVLIKSFAEHTFKWNFISEGKHPKLIILNYYYVEPDSFWTVNKRDIQILAGQQDDIKDYLISEKSYQNDDLLIFTIDLNKNSNELLKFVVEPNLIDFKRRIYNWKRDTFAFLLDIHFREMSAFISKIMNLSVQKTYKLGEELSYTLDPQHELVQKFRKLDKGIGRKFEELIKKLLDYCFNDEFKPYTLRVQVSNLTKTRRKDFIIDNINPLHVFWNNLLQNRKVEKILFDAKNYSKKLTNRDLSRAKEYLENRAYGNFIIIFSRFGIKDLSEIRDFYLLKKGVMLVLTEEDIIKMIMNKSKGISASNIIAKAYYDFLDLV